MVNVLSGAGEGAGWTRNNCERFWDTKELTERVRAVRSSVRDAGALGSGGGVAEG
jgi:hypothetical protein